MLSGREFLTPTGERVLVSDDVAYIGPGDAIRDYTGPLTCVHVVKKLGDTVCRGEAVIVVEGENGAVELYAPCAGTVVWINAALDDAPLWLVKLQIAPASAGASALG